MMTLMFYGCEIVSPVIWGVSKEHFTENLKKGEYSFLTRISLGDYELDEIYKLGSGAGYYISYVFESLDNAFLGEEFLKLEWTRRSGFYSKKAARRLLEIYLRDERYQAAEQMAVRYLLRYGVDYYFLRGLVKSLYWQQKDRTLQKLYPLIQSLNADDGEIALFKAVSAVRLQLPGWQDLVRDIFYNSKSNWYHSRLYHFLTLDEERQLPFSDDEMALFYAKRLIIRKEYIDAAAEFDKIGDRFFRMPYLVVSLRDYGKAYQATAKRGEAVNKVEMYIDSLEEGRPDDMNLYTYNNLLFTSYDVAARMYRAAKSYDKSTALFLKALEYAPGNTAFDDVLWYAIDNRLVTSLEKAVFIIENYAHLWNDPEWFDDVLEELCTELLVQGEYRFIERIFTAIEFQASMETQQRYAYVLARLYATGFLEDNKGSVDKTRERMTYYYKAAKRGLQRDYHSFMSFTYNGELPPFLTLPDKNTYAPQGWGNDGFYAYELCDGFFAYGLFDQVYKTIQSYYKEMSSEFLRYAAKRFFAEKSYYNSIRAIATAFYKSDYIIEKNDIKLLYPRAYKAEVEYHSKEEDIDPALFYSLIRQESYFNAQAHSSAGAVGLSQLMPSTALEVANRLDLADPDYRNIDTNLQIGSWYLSSMIERTGSISYALMAYNAGPHRVKTWKKIRAENPNLEALPEDLFVETIPFRETRNYVKKILVNTAIYGYLYNQRKPYDTVKIFFTQNVEE